MTTTGIVYQTLSKYHELTAGAIHNKCAGMPGIANLKSVSNALTRLKKNGRVESVYDDDKGLWLWHIVRESPVASSECAMRIGDAAAMANRPSNVDHLDHDLEMVSDITEINHETLVETREPHAHANTDDAPQTAAADAVPLSDQAEAQAGRTSEAVEHPDDVLDVLIQTLETTAQRKTMPVSVAIAEFGGYSWKEGTTLAEVFMTGIAFAEEYHKIGPNENGDYL